jgi:small subunit ribosomal protein S10
MQALASRGTVTRARPFVAAKPSVAINRSNVCRPQQQRCTIVPAASSAADIREFENFAIEEESGSSSAPLASGNVKLRVRMRGYDIGILKRACDQIQTIAEVTGAKLAGPVMLPTKKRVYCVLRSPHVNKDAREHFEIRIHNRLVDVKNLSAQTVQALMEWVPPSGLEVETSIV